jgi:Mg-chelatase subunit ChlD
LLTPGECFAQSQERDVSDVPPEQALRAIDLVIALDTSNSMEGLIDAARLTLWDVVNDLAAAEPPPHLRLALITYGNNALAGQDWVRLESDLTTDFDLISERLFELTTTGGKEYVGRVLRMATEQLSWTASDEVLKLVFIAGNEPADSDPDVALDEMITRALEQGIRVAAIYCGNEQGVDAESWRKLAELAEGDFLSIDQRRRALSITTPFDEDLIRLGEAMNATFLPLDEAAQARQRKQLRQDLNALELSPAVAASRAETKGSSIYVPKWDLVQAVEDGRLDLLEMADEDLPLQLRELPPAEREDFVYRMRVERERIREAIAELSVRRREFIETHISSRALDTSGLFDTAVRQVIRERAEEAGFEFSGD